MREYRFHGGINTVNGDADTIYMHGGVLNVSRAGKIIQYGGVLNNSNTRPPVVYRDRVVYKDRVKEKIVYRDRDRTIERVKYVETPDNVLVQRIVRLQNELKAEREAHKREVADLKERLEAVLDVNREQTYQKPCHTNYAQTWDDYRPTKAEVQAVYKDFRIWLECEREEIDIFDKISL